MNGFQAITLSIGLLVTGSVRGATNSPEAVSVKGTTVDAQGRAVEGVVVQQYGFSRKAAPGMELEMERQATSDAQGKFEIQMPRAPDVRQVAVLLVARKPGVAPAWTQWVSGSGTEPKLVLSAPSVLAGKVLDETRQPVSGAEVAVFVARMETGGEGPNRGLGYLSPSPAKEMFHAKTGTDGGFRIEGFPASASAALTVEAPGKVLRSTGPQKFGPGALPYRAGQEDIQLALEPAGSIEGKVIWAEGKAAEAEVLAMPSGPGMGALGSRNQLKTAADGSFKLTGLAAGSYRVQATFGTNTPPDWAAEPVPVTVESGQTVKGVQIQAVRGGILEVVLRSSKDAKPISEAAVNVFREGAQPGFATSSDGTARFRMLPGIYQVSAFKQGWQPANGSATVEAGATNRLELELVPPRQLLGIVRLPDGQPATNLPVRVVGDFGMQEAQFKTGPDGKFEADWNSQRFGGNNMTPSLLVRDTGRNLAVAQDLEEDTQQLDLRLAPAVSFAAKVQCDGKAITNAVGALLFRSGNMGMYLNGFAQAGAEPGQIEVLALPPGHPYGLQISAPGYGSKFIDLAQQSEEAKRVDLDPVELKRADRKLAGKLVDANDKPVEGAMVQVNGEGQPNASAQTDHEGRFSFEVCEGSVRLFANSQQEFANMSAEAGDTNVVLKLGERSMMFGGGGKPQKVQGKVTDSSGKPVAGAEVRVFPSDMMNHGKTDTNGSFAVTYMVQPWQRQNGNPLLLVRDHAHERAGAQEIFEDATNVTVQLESALTVQGHVVGSDGKPLANAQVRLMLQANRMGAPLDEQPVNTDAKGEYTFKTLPVAQDYSVYASRPGYSQKHQKVQVEWDTNVAQLPPIVLRVANQTIAGRVINAKEKPVPGIYVGIGSDDQPQSNMQTDSKGRFHFPVCEGEVRLYASGPGGFGQVSAQSGETNVVIQLMDQSMRRQPAVPRAAPKPPNVAALKGKPLPDLTSIGFAADVARGEKPVLLCLLNVQERPSRRIARLLAKREKALTKRGVTVLEAQTAPASDESWNDWKEVNTGQFPISRLAEKSEKSKWASSLENLPWLILTDRKGIVVAEGFELDELDAKLQELDK